MVGNPNETITITLTRGEVELARLAADYWIEQLLHLAIAEDREDVAALTALHGKLLGLLTTEKGGDAWPQSPKA